MTDPHDHHTVASEDLSSMPSTPGSTRPSALAGDGAAVEHRGARLDAELGYGLTLPGGLTGLPYVGLRFGEDRDVRLGWRLMSSHRQSFSLGVEASRSEAAHDHAREHRIGLETRVTWWGRRRDRRPRG